MNIKELKKEIAYANEGLAQMQEPGAGYEDQPEKLNRDVKSQCKMIATMEKQLERLERKEAK